MAQRIEYDRARQAAIADMNAKLAGCRSQYPTVSGATIIARSQCFNDAEAGVRQFVPYPDLADLRAATRMRLAEQQARGEITASQAAEQFATFSSQNVAEEQRRLAADRSVSAQEVAAAAAYRSTLGVTCTRSGNTVACF